jgi:hypothetical protein
LLDQLEAADALDLVNLQGGGRRAGQLVRASYQAATDDYMVGSVVMSRAALVGEAQAGVLVLTLTSFLPANFGLHLQPLLAPTGIGGDGTISNWNPDVPVLPNDHPFNLQGIDVRGDALLYVDGQRVAGTIQCVNGGSFTPYCSSQRVRITFAQLPTGDGPHLLQVQNPKGPLSNEFPICVGSAAVCND